MNNTNIPIPTVQNPALLERLVRRRYYHTCGQMIWLVDTPEGFVCYEELRPIMPVPITVCPRWGEILMRETLIQRRHITEG
jgi:hypothetical protein